MVTYSVFSKPLLALSVSAFAIGISEFAVIGFLSQMAFDLGFELSTAGWLVALYAVGVSVGAPVLAHMTRKTASNPICVLLLIIFATANLASAIISSFTSILIARLIAGVMHGAYFSIASTVAPALVAPKNTHLAIAVMFSGLTMAMVLGVPAGIGLSQVMSWKYVFGAVALLSSIAAILVYRFVPNLEDAVTVVVEAPFHRYLKGGLLTLYSITIFGFGGGFVLFSYVEPYLHEILLFRPSQVATVMMLVGLGSLFGNILGGKLPLRWGLIPSLSMVTVLQVSVLLAIWLLPDTAVPIYFCLFAWSVACFAVAPMVQTGVVSLASTCEGMNPRLCAGINIAAFNIGISLATVMASGYVAAGDIAKLPLFGAAFTSLALPLCLWGCKRMSLKVIA